MGLGGRGGDGGGGGAARQAEFSSLREEALH